ncbi:T9SS type A sorting domain-containing protein [Mangrovimonas cancribranchiae]|uniref:T9SS type A sorting domain-containing protein n=1 Tax=Mangrovimonas cancribranchiae TaxID=3080055 RepID=A0AAU6P2E5_9FLAO
MGTDRFSLAMDNINETAYDDGFQDGDNGGTGFGAWNIYTNGSAGYYKGGSGQGDPSFALYSDGSGNYAAAERDFPSPLQAGDQLSVDIGHSTTINDEVGEVFVQLLNQGTPVITLVFKGGASDWKFNDGGSDFDTAQPYAANTSLNFTFTYEGGNTYSFSFGSASGTNNTASSDLTHIDAVKFQSTNQGGVQNFGFNNLQLTSLYTITNNSTVTMDSELDIPYLTVDSGSSLTVSHPLSVTGDLTNNGSLIVNSGSSLIVDGTTTGDITYIRNLPTANWYLVSAPVSGQDIDTFATNEDLASGSGSNLGLAPYANDGSAWNYYQSGSSGSGSFASGTGYSVALANAGDISFTGSMPTTAVDVPIANGTANRFNLIGNPYPAYIPGTVDADATNNILDVNDAVLSEKTLWFWNQATDSYQQINHATGSRFIAPGQGFFVSASDTGGNFSFTQAMLSHQNTDTFQRNPENTRPELHLMLSNGSLTRATDIFYIDGTTTGFDNGYDSSIFSGVSNTFAIYSHAVNNSTGRDLGIQSLPNTNHDQMVIPIGVNATAGSTLTFTANAVNLPEGLGVYLEDTEAETVTSLHNGGNYQITINNTMNGTGRFYMYTSNQALHTEHLLNNNPISVYTIDHGNALRIVGSLQGKAAVDLYDISGKQVLHHDFQASRSHTVALPKLAAGIYIFRLQTANGTINKKIALD